MALSLRLEKRLARQLEAAARREGISKSEFVRRCLEQYLAQDRRRPTAWALGEQLFGRDGSGDGDLTRNRKRIVREKVRAKAHRD